MGAIEYSESSEGQFISKFFLTPKSDGNYRFILNLQEFNKFVVVEHFKLEDIRTAINMLQEGDYMCCIDLKDAYFMISVACEYRKYLRFAFKNRLFQFTSLPFGLGSCPYTYTKIMKPLQAWARRQGIRVTNYLDDFLIFGRSFQECLRFTEAIRKMLIELGFIINLEKSDFVPKTSCKFLGVIIDSVNMTIELTYQKKLNIKTTVDKMIINKKCTFEELMTLVGKLVAACPAVSSGWLYYKQLERLKYLQGPAQDCDRKKVIQLPEVALKDLYWWQSNILIAKSKIRKFTFDKEIFSDASLSGWGATCNTMKENGFWTQAESSCHINYLELLAAFNALKAFANQDNDCQILIRIDNLVAISYINKMGGIKYPHLHDVAHKIWEWCNKKQIWIFAEYIASKENPADKESRITNIDTEWELAKFAFEAIILEFGIPEIDLFATKINKKCSKFCSWQRDPEALVINAFTLSWKKYF